MSNTYLRASVYTVKRIKIKQLKIDYLHRSPAVNLPHKCEIKLAMNSVANKNLSAAGY